MEFYLICACVGLGVGTVMTGGEFSDIYWATIILVLAIYDNKRG